MSILGSILGVIFTIFLLAMITSTLFQFIGARIAGVPFSGGRILLAAIACSFVTWFCAFAFSFLPVVGTFFGIAVGVLLSLFVIMAIHQARMGQAFIIWIFNGIGQFAALVVALLTFAGALTGAGVWGAKKIGEGLGGQQTTHASVMGSANPEGDAKRIAAALEAYATDHRDYPTLAPTDDAGAVLTPAYIAELPRPGEGGAYSIRSGRSGYTITAPDGKELYRVGDGGSANASSSLYVATETTALADTASMATTGTMSVSDVPRPQGEPADITSDHPVTTTIATSRGSADVTFTWSGWGWDVKATVGGVEYDFYDAPHGVGSNFIEQSHWPAGETRTFPSADGDQSCPVRVTVTVTMYSSNKQAHVLVSAKGK